MISYRVLTSEILMGKQWANLQKESLGQGTLTSVANYLYICKVFNRF